MLLRTTDGVGHTGGAVPRGVGLAADMLAFLAAHTGLTGSGRDTFGAVRGGAAGGCR